MQTTKFLSLRLPSETLQLFKLACLVHDESLKKHIEDCIEKKLSSLGKNYKEIIQQAAKAMYQKRSLYSTLDGLLNAIDAKLRHRRMGDSVKRDFLSALKALEKERG